MKDYNFEEITRDYVNKNYSNSSPREKEKIINDWLTKPAQAQEVLGFFNKYIDVPTGKRILDFGSGCGRIAIEFSRAGAQVFGVDINPQLIDIAKGEAKRLNSNVEFLLSDGFTLPFKGNFFDFSICLSVFEHLSNPVVSLKEIIRVLRPKGKLWLVFPNRLYPFEGHTLLFFINYMPRSIANWYATFRKRATLDDYSLHFYSYIGFVKVLKRHNLPLKILSDLSYNPNNRLKNFIKRFLARRHIHYTALTEKINLVLEKTETFEHL